jgi:Porin PorA
MWVDQLTGTTVDAQSTQTITAAMKSPIGTIPLTAVLTAQTDMSPAGVALAVKNSKDDQSKLALLGTDLPVGLTVVAVAMLAGAAWLFRRRPGGQTPSEAAGRTDAVTAGAI